jgi:hypothetical protein
MRGRGAATAPASSGPTPGSFFGVPGLTQWTDQAEANSGAVVALSQTAQTPWNTAVPFKQTDVVFWWDFGFSWTNTATAGAGQTITTSQYFPYNVISESALSIQNMYNSVHCLSGVDLAIWQLIRPMRSNTDEYNYLGANPSALWAGATAALEANQVSGNAQSSASTAINFSLEFPVSLELDFYFDILKDGTLNGQPHRAIVSPQYMAGSARILAPSLKFAAGFSANTDQGPFTTTTATSPTTDTPSTYAGSITLDIIRHGVYGSNNVALMPVVYNWQYIRDAKNYGIAGKTVVDIPIPTYGQILSIFVRMYDPTAGAAIDLTALTKAQLQYGSGLLRFDDTPMRNQRRWFKQHGCRLPVGIIVWDMGLDDYGRVTNANALNTLTTAGVNIHLEFASAVSSTAYIVVGVEALSYVD